MNWETNRYTGGEVLKLSDGISVSILKFDSGFLINIMGQKEYYNINDETEAKLFAIKKLKEKLEDTLKKLEQ